eukprot:CAMPEP_0197686964 /NCGR_PEP_ID=MMETSP1338-20131121/103311_1 /TAXON_ID=43686 ORGANISM="Pelagodinium beii, Strain RCC1491" /NCGR_SAMPLE_ID=MMETSP1338 /ASSEMBLY_ACC=CAM_ASM_000754 /LENGTH=134 /DNA_ID=CAMNT_0043268987 /DNA_START=105 /DNA_END=506 /DNA_ORIENTATION=-
MDTIYLVLIVLGLLERFGVWYGIFYLNRQAHAEGTREPKCGLKSWCCAICCADVVTWCLLAHLGLDEKKCCGSASSERPIGQAVKVQHLRFLPPPNLLEMEMQKKYPDMKSSTGFDFSSSKYDEDEEDIWKNIG